MTKNPTSFSKTVLAHDLFPETLLSGTFAHSPEIKPINSSKILMKPSRKICRMVGNTLYLHDVDFNK